jgi:protocatechuate 3,4-dioxygenase beta subunit
MPIRRLSPILLLSLVALVTGVPAPSVFGGGADIAPGEPSEARKLQRQLQRLDREIQALWNGIPRGSFAGDESPAGGADLELLSERTDRLRRWLTLLEIEAHAVQGEPGRGLRAKVRSLRRGLDNLDLLAAGQDPPASGVMGPRSVAGASVRLLAAAVKSTNDCAGAPKIGDGLFTGTTVGATNDGTASCGVSDFTADVWFRYVAAADGTVSVDTFGSEFDTVLSVHTGCPGVGSELKCNDDSAGLQSALSFTTEAGLSYWIRISGVDGATGRFELRVGPGGGLAGRVTTAGTGDPVTDGEVVVSSPFGFAVQSAPLTGGGTYSLGGLNAFGSYLVHTETQQGRRDEVWDDHPCFGGLLCDLSVGDPVAVNSLDTTAGIDFALDPGGAIAGSVRHGATGDPIEGVRLEAWWFQPPVEPRLAASTVTHADGTYTLEGLDSGSYLVIAKDSEWGDELYDDVACSGGFDASTPQCEPVEGAVVPVTLGGTTGGVDFDLVRLGVFEGTVTNASTGEPIEGARVEAETETLFFFGSAFTDALGKYRIGGLGEGSYALSAEKTDFLSEVYPEMDCPFPCHPLSFGTTVFVAPDQILTDLDFTLERLGSISGTWTDAVSGDPITGGIVGVFGSDGQILGGDFLVDGGVYQVSEIPAGDHFVRADPDFGSVFLRELYDDVPCFDGCQLAAGTPVTVLPGTDTPGIDFVLDRGGTLTGTLTDSLTGVPLEGVTVLVLEKDGGLRASPVTNAAGTYTAEGLPPKSYLALALTSLTHAGELYDDIPCFGGLFGGCALVDGTPIPVTVNSTVADIDFALDPLGSISGRVSEVGTGAAIDDGRIEIFDSAGLQIGDTFLGVNGGYLLDDLAPGDYFLRTDTDFSAAERFVDELFDDVPCDPTCDVTAGTPVSVAPGAAVQDIDFELEDRTAISGRVVNAATGEPVGQVEIRIHDVEDSFVGFALTDATGSYRSNLLLPGTYFVLALKSPFLAEVYDDILCTKLDFSFRCDATKGTPVELILAGDTPGIDFELEILRAGLTGTVLDQATGRPVAGVGVRIWDSGGSLVRQVTTRHDGVWLADLPIGTYFASTDAGPEYFDQVYDGMVCVESCDPSTGTPLTVATTSTIFRGIDFILQKTPPIFTDGFESGDLAAWSRRVTGPP